MRNEKDHSPIAELPIELLKAYQTTFIGREDCYPIQLDKGSYVTVKKPLTPYLVTAHLKGTVTIGAYALDADSQAKWLCLDGDTDDHFQSLIRLAEQLDKENITSYLEQSRRGGHLWLFTSPMLGANIRQFGKQLMLEYGLPETIELYPKQDRLITGTGSLVRLPLGIHRKTGRRYHFVTPDGQPLAPTVREQIAILSNPNRVSSTFIGQVLALAPEPEPRSPTPTFEKLKTGQGNRLSEVLKSTMSVQQLVSQYVQLDAQGRGHCPFHDDQHQSFQVNVQGNYWHCYAGCGGGSIIDFWMKWRTTHGQDGSFTETIKELREMMI